MEAAMSKIARKNTEAYLWMYRQMARSRTFEDNANQLYLSAKMPGLTGEITLSKAVNEAIAEEMRRDPTV
jgi:TPP-dependent pyruvate/acetoin dehydrogenase alpha subunit